MSAKKLAISAMLAALAVSPSSFAIPIGTSKCFPIQHLANVVIGVFPGPGYGVTMTFCASLMRNFVDTGSPLAFPGSTIGVLIRDLVYWCPGKLILAYAGEIFSTGIVGGILCYPVTTMVVGKEAAIFAHVVPFLMSTLCDTVITAFLIGVLYKPGVFKHMKHLLDTGIQPSKAVGK